MKVFTVLFFYFYFFFSHFFFFFPYQFQVITGDIYAGEIHHLVLLSHTWELFIHPSKGLRGW